VILQGKIAVVYGAGGAFGGAVARAFAAEGAEVFATGRSAAPVETVVKDIAAAGGAAEAAVVDAADEEAVDAHLRSVADGAGHVDISFNAVGVADTGTLGTPLTEIAAEAFFQPVRTSVTSYFLTSRLAARHMIPRGSGVIMTVTSPLSRTGTRLNGGYGPADAAKEALTRDLSAELAPRGLRVVGLRSGGVPGTGTMREAFDAKAEAMGYTLEQFEAYLAGAGHRQRAMTVEEVAAMAVCLASDRASGMTGTTVNLTLGSMDD
jgi:NAD(P)-dependent dehydrogenase (short-subunit alcohol dehydrogenase family)